MGSILPATSDLVNTPLEIRMYYGHESHLIEIQVLRKLAILQYLRNFIIQAQKKLFEVHKSVDSKLLEKCSYFPRGLTCRRQQNFSGHRILSDTSQGECDSAQQGNETEMKEAFSDSASSLPGSHCVPSYCILLLFFLTE